MNFKNECVEVKIHYGYGISFLIPMIVEKGTSDEKIKEVAIKHFKAYMPSQEQVQNVDSLLDDNKAFVEVEHTATK